MNLSPKGARVAVALCLVAGVACASSPRAVPPAPPVTTKAAPAIIDGAAVVRAMYARYAGKWYSTLIFSQTTTITRPTGTLVQTWLEAGKLPGRLRIDTDSLGQTGVIYAGDSVYSFSAGKLAATRQGRNELLVLGFDVYAQPPEVTIAVLRGLGVDMSKMHRTTWEGRPVFVVGAAEGDWTSKQFWVDEERLLFVRLLQQTVLQTGPRNDDIRFQKYVQHGGGWVAEEVVMLSDGKPRLHEEYANVRVNVGLDEALFDPKKWAEVKGWFSRQ
jgi:hypothetical protein